MEGKWAGEVVWRDGAAGFCPVILKVLVITAVGLPLL